MKTQQIYLTNSYEKTLNAKVIDIVASDKDNEQILVLGQTIFYPMGGGQPTDQGIIEYSGNKFEVYQIMIVAGEIYHYTKGSNLQVNDSVNLELNWERRYKHMRLHSAGHVIDFAMYQLGYSPEKVSPQKGDHGKKPYIVYSGILEKDITEELEQKANEIVEADTNIFAEFMPLEELEKKAIYLQPNLPSNKPLRALTFEGIGTVADGGTQVSKTSEVGSITIVKIEEKDGNTIVNYQIT